MNMKIVTGGKVEVSKIGPANIIEKAAMPGLNVENVDDVRKKAATQPSAATIAAVNHAKIVESAFPILKVVAHVPDAAEYLVRKAA